MAKRQDQAFDAMRQRVRKSHRVMALAVVQDDAYVPVLRRLAEALTDFAAADVGTEGEAS